MALSSQDTLLWALVIIGGLFVVTNYLALAPGEDYVNLADKEIAFSNFSCTIKTEIKPIGGGNLGSQYVKSCESEHVKFSYLEAFDNPSQEGTARNPTGWIGYGYEPSRGLYIQEPDPSAWVVPTTVEFKKDLFGSDAMVRMTPFGDLQNGFSACSGEFRGADNKVQFSCGDIAEIRVDRLDLKTHDVYVNGDFKGRILAGPINVWFTSKNVFGFHRLGFGSGVHDFRFDLVGYRTPFTTCQFLPDEIVALRSFRPGEKYDLYSFRSGVDRMCAQVPAVVLKEAGFDAVPEINKGLLKGDSFIVPQNQIHNIQYVTRAQGVTCSAGEAFAPEFKTCVNPFRFVTFCESGIFNATSQTCSASLIDTGCPTGSSRDTLTNQCVAFIPLNQPCASGSLLPDGSCSPSPTTCPSGFVLNNQSQCVKQAEEINIPTVTQGLAGVVQFNQSATPTAIVDTLEDDGFLGFGRGVDLLVFALAVAGLIYYKRN